jgi:hypothetical protein
MANLNLSQFTEKTFVADADWVFVWDAAGLISKKVSRNNWLNSGELSTSAPVTISQTWNAVGQTFKALVVNAAGTSDANSASGSLLLDLQLGGTTKAKIDKLGIITANRIILDQSGSTYQLPTNTPIFWSGSSFLRSPSVGVFSFENNTQANFFTLVAEAANTLALRNGAAAQTFNVYGTYTSGTSYERLTLSAPSAANAIIGTNKGSGGGTARGLDFHTEGTARMTIGTTGNVGIGTTAPAAPLEIRATAGTTNRESLLKCTVSDAGNDAFHIFNATSTDGRFSPGFSGSTFTHQGGISFVSQTNAANDTGTGPFMLFQGRITSSETDPNNGTFSNVATRPLFAWWNLITPLMQLNANGNLGIGTTAPSSKLQVSAGDVEVDTIAKGVILKSPDGTRYRVTVANGGTLSVAAV